MTVESIVHDVATFPPYLMAVAGKVTIEGQASAFVYLFDSVECVVGQSIAWSALSNGITAIKFDQREKLTMYTYLEGEEYVVFAEVGDLASAIVVKVGGGGSGGQVSGNGIIMSETMGDEVV